MTKEDDNVWGFIMSEQRQYDACQWHRDQEIIIKQNAILEGF